MKTAIITSKNLRDGRLRFEGKYYLNEDSINSRAIENHPTKCTVLSAIATVFNPPIFKRQFCQPTNNAVQYFQSSDVPVNIENSTVYVNKLQVKKIGALVEQNDILVTGFGTIGNVRMVSKTVAGSCFANNVCRIRANDNIGFIYAFFASKYGKSQLNKNASGAVVRYIEAPGIKRTLIPVFPTELQNEIDGLIRSAASLRDQANELLDKAKGLLMDYIGEQFSKSNGYKTARTSITDIRHSLKMRLDPPVFINDGVKMLQRLSDKTKPLGECGIKLFYPGMFKRAYVKDGYPYMKGSDVFDVNPFTHCEHLSKTRTPKLDQLWLTDGMLLISCAGACGSVKMITKEYQDKQAIGSPDIIRLVSNDHLFTGEYLFAYLSLPMVYDFMQSLKYGAVIERFDVQNIETVPIVIPTIELSETITALIKEYKDCTYKAFCNEEQAISMVETEIESWNHKPTMKS